MQRGVIVAIMIVLIGTTAARLAPLYTTFTATYDEPFQIAAGIEWLDNKTYTCELLHPPLARIAVALGPYLEGSRPASFTCGTGEGNAILQSGGNYWRNLTLARFGNLPFLMLACVVILMWARRWFTLPTGISALLLFLSLPPILGHAALATLDLACASTLLAAVYHLLRWLEQPAWWRSVVLGAMLALAFLTKFSNVAFVAVCCLMLFIDSVLIRKNRQWLKYRLMIGQTCLVACIALAAVWAGYRFDVAPISHYTPENGLVERWFGSTPSLRDVVDKTLKVPLPLSPFIVGLAEVYYRDKSGDDNYLLGQYRRNGWWYFFPIVVAVKTPLGFLILAIAGLGIVFWRIQSYPWQWSATAFFPIAILLFSMTSRINLGVRHVLAIYPFLALMAGHALCTAFQKHRTWLIMSIAAILAFIVVTESWMAHPDYLAYFNPLAGSHPEKILAESDLDWGQDLHRLSQRLRSLDVKEITIGYFGSAPLEIENVPPHRMLSPVEKATGYVAVSVRFLTLDYARDGSYAWLKQYTPIERIGKSILLYWIP